MVDYLNIKTNAYKYDLVSLGEVMIRFDPGDSRIRKARSFQIWEGGGEYNVARGLSSSFDKSTAIVTALVDNEIGKLLKELILAGGLDISYINCLEDDGIGRSARNGVYYLERGFGTRAPLGASDRANTAISKMEPGDVDWEHLFGNQGVRWFHTGGIYAGLSDIAPEVIVHAAKIARKHGTIVSYDLNYRPSLWKCRGGKQAADKVNDEILKHVDVLFGVDSLETSPICLDFQAFRNAIQKMLDSQPHLKAVASTMRIVKSANVNDWSGLLWVNGSFYEGICLNNLEIYDRVGGGDSFASGLIFGMMENESPQKSINYAVTHGALTMSTPGDNSMATKEEVEKLTLFQDASVFR